MLKIQVWSSTQELFSVRVDQANFRADLIEMAAVVQWIVDDADRCLFAESTEVQITYGGMVFVDKHEIQEELVDGWKKVETSFEVESPRTAVRAWDALHRHYLIA